MFYKLIVKYSKTVVRTFIDILRHMQVNIKSNVMYSKLSVTVLKINVRPIEKFTYSFSFIDIIAI